MVVGEGVAPPRVQLPLAPVVTEEDEKVRATGYPVLILQERIDAGADRGVLDDENVTLLQVAANPYVAVLGKPQTASSRLNLTQAFNSLGTAVFPWVGARLILGESVSAAAQSARPTHIMARRMRTPPRT